MAEDTDDDDDTRLCVARARCRTCSFEYVAVFPETCDDDNLECGQCGHMTCEAYEYIEAEVHDAACVWKRRPRRHPPRREL